jgi:anti-anti-sigma factor
MPDETARFTVNRSNGEIVVAAAGEIDAYTSSEFASVVEGVSASDSHLVIDLSGVTFMDSSGVSVLAEAATSRGPESRIRVRGAAPIVRRVLTLTGIDSVVTVDSEVD